MNDSALFVLETLLILGLPYVIWHGARARFFVPCAVIQIALGLMIGPSFLGRLSPDVYAYLFSPANLSKISGIASFSVLLFAFIAGIHLDRRSYSSGGSKLAVVGISSVFAPLVLGLVVGWWIFNSNPAAVGKNVEEWRFALAIGVAVSVTALPVLGSILREMQLLRESLGQWVLGLAAINDVALWVLVSVLLVKTGDAGSLWKQLGLFAAYLAFMFAVLRPILQKLFADVNEGNFSDMTLAAMASHPAGSRSDNRKPVFRLDRDGDHHDGDCYAARSNGAQLHICSISIGAGRRPGQHGSHMTKASEVRPGLAS